MRKVLTWALILVAAAAVIGGVIWWRQTRPPEPVGDVLRTAEIARGDLQLSVAASGSLAVKERTELLIRTPGRVTDVLVEPNERVEAGQMLARMDTADLERSLRQAEIGLQQAELALATAEEVVDPEEIRLAELALDSAAASLEVARLGKQTARVDSEAMMVEAQREREMAYIRYRDTEWDEEDRALTAFRDAEAEERIAGLNAELLVEQAESQYQAAYASYEQARRSLEELQAGPDEEQIEQQTLQVEQAKLRLEQIRRNLDESTIKAPYAGIVASVHIEEGVRQQAGQPAFTLIDDAAYYVEVTVDEIDIGAIAVEQDVAITLDAYPEVTLDGTVERVAPASTELGGLTTYRVRVRVTETQDTRALEGMTASVNIRTRVVEDVLLIPNWAIQVDQEQAEAFTYLMLDDLPQRTTLELGQRSETFTEVLSGLEEGDTVALVIGERSLLDTLGGPLDD